MPALWERVCGLEGQTLATQKQRKSFRISEVDPRRGLIRVTPEESRRGGTGSYAVYRKHFEEAEQAGLFNANVTSQALKDAGLDHGTTSYMAAILEHLAHQ